MEQKNIKTKKYIDHCTMIFNDGNFDDAKSENIINYLCALFDFTIQ